ncbi:hypothetical protein FE634_14610 [Nocardioides dongxiaopingii]|uniref:hypothetical protein n=1 Tax=Nocardioides sp. S-1144 TaxID=2582905 RepID=UPI001162D0F4|nr:hypothetical protein [Nocardioides sp. S-1144]QCW51326.2 hypothetical protein FE634_14610 [Nocardioides sp. S-1144]
MTDQGPSSGAPRVATDVDGCVTLWADRDGWWVAEHARGQERVRAAGHRAPDGLAAGSAGGGFVAWSGTTAESLTLDGDVLQAGVSRTVPDDLRAVAAVGVRAGGVVREVWCGLDRVGGVHVLGWDGEHPTTTEVSVPGARGVFVNRRLRCFIVLGEAVTVIAPDAAEPAPWVAGALPAPPTVRAVAFDEVLEVVWRAEEHVLVAEGLRAGRLVEMYRVPVAAGVSALGVSGGGEWLLLGREDGDDTLLNVAARREMALPDDVAAATVRAFGYDARLCALSADGVVAVDLPARAELRDVTVGTSTAAWDGRMTKTSSVALRRDPAQGPGSRRAVAGRA